MKKKSLLLCSGLALLSVGSLSGCAGLQNTNNIIVWVGSESVEYYRDLQKQFLAENPEFGYKITIVGADTGSVGGQMVADNTSCGDIVTIAHDNIGKLSRVSYIAPIVDSDEVSKELLDQIDADNPESFKKVIKNIYGENRDYEYVFAAPYISQALFLYYDTRYVTDTEADSFEGLIAAAQRYDQQNGVTKTKSYTVTGNDGFNFTFSLLARNIQGGGNSSSLRLYVDDGTKTDDKGVRYDSYCQTNEEVAVMRWMQRNYKNPNGGLLESDSPWATNIEQHKALSVIGGAWHYNSFKKAVTDDSGVHMGCKVIPTFTLTAQDVAGIEQVTVPNDSYISAIAGHTDPAPQPNTLMRGGSFVDCKAFVINMAKMTGPEKYYKMCQIIKYFSTKQAQNESFLKALNVPAYEGAEEYIESVKDQVDETAYKMAKAQTGMSPYGIAQPITNATLNTFYYQKDAPKYYLECVKNDDGKYGTVEAVRKQLFRIEYVWKHGGLPASDPSSFPSETSTSRD